MKLIPTPGRWHFGPSGLLFLSSVFVALSTVDSFSDGAYLAAQSVGGHAPPSAQVPNDNDAANVATASQQLRLYLPFRLGSRWTSSFTHSEMASSQHGPGKILQFRGQFTETVASVDNKFGGSIQIVEVVRSGSASPRVDCDSLDDQASPRSVRAKFWYVLDSYRVFTACSLDAASGIAKMLAANPTKIAGDDTPDYVLPFEVGKLWGLSPDSAKREDTFYQWDVESKEPVKVAAGRFSGCYEIAYRTLPDHTIRWICPGVGLAALEYAHHGTPNEYRIELVKYERGSTVRHR